MSSETQPTVGLVVYAEDGTKLGTIRGFDGEGFYVTTRDGIVGMSIEHERAGHEFGEAELMWRCSNCGEMGDIEALPDSCPNCGARREEIYYWTED